MPEEKPRELDESRSEAKLHEATRAIAEDHSLHLAQWDKRYRQWKWHWGLRRLLLIFCCIAGPPAGLLLYFWPGWLTTVIVVIASALIFLFLTNARDLSLDQSVRSGDVPPEIRDRAKRDGILR